MEFKPNVVFMLVCWNMIYAVSPERDKQSQAKTYFRKSLQGYPYTNLVPGAKYKQKYAERSLPFSALVGKDSLESSEVGKAKTRTNLALDYDVIETVSVSCGLWWVWRTIIIDNQAFHMASCLELVLHCERWFLPYYSCWLVKNIGFSCDVDPMKLLFYLQTCSRVPFTSQGNGRYVSSGQFCG